MGSPTIPSSPTSNTASGSVNITINEPSGLVGGDILFAIIAANTTGTAIGVTIGSNLAFASVSTQVNSTSIRLTVFVHRVSDVIGREPASWTFNTGATSSNWAGLLVPYRGLAGTSPILGATNTTTASGTTQNAPTQTEILFSYMSIGAAWTSLSDSVYSAPPSGFSIQAQVTNSSGISVAWADKYFTSPFAATGTLGVTTTGTGVGVGISTRMYPAELNTTIVDSFPSSPTSAGFIKYGRSKVGLL
jgi:hypothetical protein